MDKESSNKIENRRKYAQFSVSLRLKEEEGILGCQVRFKNSDLEFDNRYPIILPKEQNAMRKYITQAYVKRCANYKQNTRQLGDNKL